MKTTKNIMDTKKITGLERQDAFIKSIAGQDFDFGLVMTQAFLKGIRDIGYKSTATALFENIDNSVQAEASIVNVLFDFDKGKSGKNQPDRIAIVDDGYGMSKEMIRIAVLWGGSDRIDDRQGMGKYGYGLPSSCVSIGQRFTVISKREDVNGWYSVTIDVEEIANRKADYIDVKTGRIVAPTAKLTQIPAFVKEHLDNKGITLNSGTIVLIEKIDRLSRKNFASLKGFLITETGVTYRNFLRTVDISIDGDKVDPIDPLFITEGLRYFDENDLRAEVIPGLDIKVRTSRNEKIEGTVKIRYSYMPYGFFDPKKSEELDEQPQDLKPKEKEEDELYDVEKRIKSFRLRIRKDNNGIIFLRKGRQIDVIDSRCPWTKFQNNDRYIGVEVDFSPELDEDFSITTAKQQVVVSDRLWNILRDNGVYEIISKYRKVYNKQSDDARIKLQALKNEPEKLDSFAESIMNKAAVNFEDDPESLPTQVKNEGKENFKKRVKKIADETGLSEEKIEEELRLQEQQRPYRIDYMEELEGPFYRPEQVGGQVVIFINKEHRFYNDLYEGPQTNAYTKNALALLLFVMGQTELRVNEDRRKFYKTERGQWSQKLDLTLEILTQHFAKSNDDKMAAEEMTTADSENLKA
ncbi:MAG: hypothetical protein JWQ66_2129 [Mucilaginibacter sp.]|nr:hypothetical protein [Mucilaginibacter sp.]